MYGKILFYITLASFLFLLPDKVWNPIYTLSQKISLKFEQYVEFIRKKNILYGGHTLINQLSAIEVSALVGMKNVEINLPKYKFYTALIDQCLNNSRKYGSKISRTINDLRSGLIKDCRFESKLRKDFFGGFAQLIIVAILTWIFIGTSYHLAEVKLQTRIYVLICSMQFLGGFFYTQAYRRIKIAKFAHFYNYFSCIYTMQSLSSAGVPVRSVLEKSEIQVTLKTKQKIFKNVNRRLKVMVEKWLKSGGSVQQEIEGLLDEIWFLQEQSFIAFERVIAVLKLSVITGFFLSAYLVYLFFLFNHFLMI